MWISDVMELVRALWRARITFFWPIWIASTVMGALGVALVVGHASTPIISKGSITPERRQVWTRNAVAAMILLCVFLGCYVSLIPTWEDFCYPDNSMFTLSTLRGENLGPPIWPQNGRFFPLGHQEFNLIRRITGTVIGYHVFPIIELFILCSILLILDGELRITSRVCLTAIVLATPSVVISFGGLIYDERNLALSLVCMVFCAKRFQQTFSTRWAVATSVCAQIMVYYKETAFLLVWGFAAGSLIWHCWNREKRGWDLNRLRDKESRLNLCLFSIGFLFLLYYLAVMLPHFNVRYANDHRIPGAEVVGDYFKLDLLAWLFLALFIRRSYMILRGRVEPSPLWEGLAFGGAAYFVSYLYLGMYSGYYLAPVDLIAVLYVGRWAFMSWERRGLVTKVAITVSVVAILIQDVSLSAFRVFERKNVIHGKAEIARVVKLQFQRSAGNPQRIFFPFSSPYSVMEFAAYLSYRGVPVEGGPDDTTGMSHVVLVRRAPAKIGPCVDYKRILCHAATSPGAGDLVIVMPDDGASAADIAPYRDGGEPLLSYEPYPPIPQWMSPLLNYLHVVSYAFPNKKLPDRWLHASVVMWNQSGNR